MGRNLFAESNEAGPVRKGRNLFAEEISPVTQDIKLSAPNKAPISPFSGMGINLPENPEVASKLLKEGTTGAAQAYANYPIQIANLATKKPFNLLDFAPKTGAGEAGKAMGELGSYFLPGKGLSVAGKLVPGIKNAMAARPFLNSVLGIGKAGAEAALFNAAHKPEEAGMAALQGAGLGSGAQIATNLIASKNPLLRMMARAALGAGIGLPLGHPGYGAAAGMAAPQALELLGHGNANKLLEGLEPRDIAAAKNANDLLGTSITPAQASGNYVTAGLEGALKRHPESAQYAFRLEKAQERGQKQAINAMLDKIYKPTSEHENKINALYERAEKVNLTPNAIKNMKDNPIIENAFKITKSNAAFSKVPENNYKFLAEVNRQLFRDYQGALKTNPNEAFAIQETKKKYDEFLRSANPHYKEALEAAAPKLTRRSIEEKFNKNEEDFTGKNFYNKFFNTKKSYSDILRQTKSYPEAQADLMAMRKGWKHLSNIKSVSQGEAQSKTGLSDARDQFKAMVEHIKKMSAAKNDIKTLKFAYSKDWDKEFDNIMSIKEQNTRNKKLLNLFGKVGTAYGLNNLESQGDKGE